MDIKYRLMHILDTIFDTICNTIDHIKEVSSQYLYRLHLPNYWMVWERIDDHNYIIVKRIPAKNGMYATRVFKDMHIRGAWGGSDPTHIGSTGTLYVGDDVEGATITFPSNISKSDIKWFIKALRIKVINKYLKYNKQSHIFEIKNK